MLKFTRNIIKTKKSLQEMEKKTGDAWKVFAEGTNKAWNELREAVHR